MSDRRLRDDLRDYYQAKEPSEAMLDRLKAMDVAAHPPAWQQLSPRTVSLLAAAAVAVVAVGLGILMPAYQSSDLGRAIADEIALNHQKQFAADFEATSYGELRRVMDKLDFALAEPTRIAGDGARLVGARYCSIQGQLAAQLRLEAADGERLTLYQTARTQELAKLGETQLEAGGLVIDLWQEGGAFLGMARAP